MKSITLSVVLGLFFVSAAHAAPKFSAFADGDDLHITVLKDCNTITAQLEVAPTCKEGRPFKNLAPFCSAELIVSATELACPHHEPLVPATVTLSLKKSKVAHEAQILEISYLGESVEVDLR
ncbi:hypothetical protein K2X30_12730 [bacterium]|nr:hypothetical protein [bacterium]